MFNRFRFHQDSLLVLLDMISPYLPSHTNRSHALSNENRLLLTLRELSGNLFFISVGDHFGVDKSTASRSFWEVVDALFHLVPELVRVDLLQREESQNIFAEKGLSGVLG